MKKTLLATSCLLLLVGASVLLATDPPAGSNAGKPASPAAAPDTQPDEEVAKPTVMKVGLSAPPAARAGEVIVPDKSETPESPKGEPPAIPSGEDLVDWILKSHGEISGAKGSVPTAKDLDQSLSGNIFPTSVKTSRPTVASVVQPAGVAADSGVKLLPEGYVVRDRVGFIKRDRGRFTFVFEDNTGRDAPLTLLPNKSLESALSQSHAAADNVRFRVTGTVTQYQNSNYLLLQMVLIEQDLGRF